MRLRAVVGSAVGAALAVLALFTVFGRESGPTARSGPSTQPSTAGAPALLSGPVAVPDVEAVEVKGSGSPAEPPPDAGITLLVRVVEEGGGPVPGAQVRACAHFVGENRRWTAVADAQGSVRIPNVPMVPIDVRADAEGYAGRETEGLSRDAPGELDVTLTLERGIAFDGHVVAAQDGSPVAGAEVVACRRDSAGNLLEIFDCTESDAQGRFHVRGVPEGSAATIDVEASGHPPGSLPVRVSNGAVVPNPVVVALAPGGIVRGTVRDPEGRPVPGAAVYVLPASDIWGRKDPISAGWSHDGRARVGRSDTIAVRATTDSGGGYAAMGLALETEYIAVAVAEGFGRSEEVTGLRLDTGRMQAAADLVLRPVAVLIVRLLDLDGRPLTTRATVYLGKASPGETALRETSDTFRFEGIPPRDYDVHVHATSFRVGTATAHVEAGATTEVDVRMDPGATVAGVVVDEAGAPVANAEVEVGHASQDGSFTRYRSVQTDGRGRFDIRGVEPGVALLRASTRDRPRARTLAPVEVTAPASDLRPVLVLRGAASLRLLAPDGLPFDAPVDVRAVHPDESGEMLLSACHHDGTYVIDDLDDGSYEIEIAPEGFAPLRRSFVAAQRRPVDLGDIRLDEGVPASGRVVDTAGAPVRHARIVPPGRYTETSTDGQGVFRLQHLRAERTRVQVMADGFLSRDFDLTPSPEAVEIRLVREAVVHIVLRDAAGKAVPRATLIVKTLEDITFPTSAWRTEDDGRVVIQLAPGRWSFAVKVAPDENSESTATAELALAEGDVKTLNLTLGAR